MLGNEINQNPTKNNPILEVPFKICEFSQDYDRASLINSPDKFPPLRENSIFSQNKNINSSTIYKEGAGGVFDRSDLWR